MEKGTLGGFKRKAVELLTKKNVRMIRKLKYLADQNVHLGFSRKHLIFGCSV